MRRRITGDPLVQPPRRTSVGTFRMGAEGVTWATMTQVMWSTVGRASAGGTVSGEVPSAPENSPARPGELPVPAGDTPAVPGQFAVGSQIAGYRVMEQIGRGGMAVVYRAIDLRLDRPVALKILAPELARDEAFRHRFIRECRAAAAVDHPCIIPVFDAGEASGVLFIAMRYVSGRDVRTLLDREGSLPADRVVNIIEQVASALDAAHARGLVHRDVKPANMLLDSAASSGHLDHVYLADFGLTKGSLQASGLTGTGTFLGTGTSSRRTCCSTPAPDPAAPITSTCPTSG